jgi:hypothetical protein
MQNLVPALRSTYTISVGRNNANGIATRTQVLPQGLTFTLQARPNSGYSFLNWSGSFSSSSRIAQFTTGSAAMSITANFSGGSTGVTRQAETGTLSGGAILESTNGGYNGTGYVNFPLNGGICSMTGLDGGSGGAKTLVIRYANGSTSSRTGLLVVNGANTGITFPATGAWTTWTTMSVAITLNSGTGNTIELRSTGSDLANIDEIRIQ